MLARKSLLGQPRLLNKVYNNTSHDNQVLQHIAQLNNTKEKILHIFEAGKKLSLEKLMKKDEVWITSLSNELGRVMNGVGNRITGTDTMEFVRKENVPKNKKVTYANFVCDYRPLKTEKHRVRMTIGGDRLDYPDETASPAASLIETKLILNSVISDAKKGARFMTMELKDHFLQTVMKEAEYMRIHKRFLTEEIRHQYKTDDLVAVDGYIYCKIKRGMYGLKQAARLAYDLIKQRLAPYRYHPDNVCPNIWTHETRKTVFCLCVDDFGVKYFNKDDADHLISALHEYKVTTDWSETNYCGLKIKWNYNEGWTEISMPNYVNKTLKHLKN